MEHSKEYGFRLPDADVAKDSGRTTSTRSLNAANEPGTGRLQRDQSRRGGRLRAAKTLYQAVRRFILQLPQDIPSTDGRHVPIDPCRVDLLIDNRTGRAFKNNFIKSSKYTYWSFLPLQLVAQFSKLVNFYFLCISILQLIPGFSTTGRFTSLAPLLVFVSLSIAKEGYEDLRRHRLDVEENRREAKVLRRNRIAQEAGRGAGDLENGENSRDIVQWQNLRVGDIVALERDEAVPADLVLFSCVSNNHKGHAYFETMALDGETSLKAKRPTVVTASVSFDANFDVALRGAEMVAEDPNLDLHHFEGKITLDGKTFTPLTINELVLRGSILRDTTSAIGMVVYSGEECKIRMNANKTPRIKAPALQASVNRIVVLMVGIVVLLAVCLAVACIELQHPVDKRPWYLSEAGVSYGKALVSYVLMFNALVPLSLYISLEFVKIYQMDLMNADIDMYHEESNTPFEARTSTINEQLGQVSYIFSDKTGTLTENVMRFRKLSVGGRMWSHLPDDDDGTKTALGPKTSGSGSNLEGILPPNTVSTTANLVSYMQAYPRASLTRRSEMMIKCMAICHTCFPEREANHNDVSYLSSSPDELALVQAAKEMGYVAFDRQSSTLTLKIYSNNNDVEPDTEVYEILHVLEFSSDRRRMSVIVRFPDGRCCVICKGADSVLIERLRLAEVAKQQMDGIGNPRVQLQSDDVEDNDANATAWVKKSVEHIDMFATDGLRTLLYGYRFLEENEYHTWREVYQDASTSLSNRHQKLDDAAERIEQLLELGGVTAIEDKLQQGVPETLDRLKRANIKLWMLTGDKRETAINIARSCGLVQKQSHLTVVDYTAGDVEEAINSALEHIKTNPTVHSVMVIDGQTLNRINSLPSLHALFLDLAIHCSTTICCRASPRQKATLIRSIRKRTKAITLAIGDGANDVPMLQEAHVGIGITGKEGLQAARVSDYSIAQFRFLSKLLLVHGRWNYVRTAKYTLGMFWKELLFYLTQALFQRWNVYTGTSLYEPWSLTTFQGVWTPLPVVFLGIFEKDLRASTIMAVPELYNIGPQGAAFNFRVYLGWMFMAITEAVIIFFVIKSLYGDAGFTRGQDLFAIGTLSYSTCLVVINLKLQLVEQHNISVTAVICNVLELGGWFLWNILFAQFYTGNEGYIIRGAFTVVFGRNALWWFTLVVAVAACLLFEVAVGSIKTKYFPSDVKIFQQLEKDAAVRKRFEAMSSSELRARVHERGR